MINPYTGILLSGKYYGYVADSFNESLKIKNSVSDTQTSRTASILGKSKETFTLTLSLDSTYNVYAGSSFVGQTVWVGVSRLVDLKSLVGSVGASVPLNFITPYGASYTVVPVGSLDISIFNPENPQDSANGTEFRASLTLEVVDAT